MNPLLMTIPFWLAIAVLLVVATTISIVRAIRAGILQRIRDEWGQPIERSHRMDDVASSHRSRRAATGAASMDDRTWADLDMDAVFAALDRTGSTLGQHALYHRLRTIPVAVHLEAFEALVARMTEDETTRERAQIVLARLQDPQGYDLWWVARPEAIDTRRWDVIFPILSAAALALLAVAPFWHGVVPALVATLIINVAVRNVTDRRVGAVSAAFRQMAPIIATGQSLMFLKGEAIEPLVGPLSADAPSLGRLKTIARWVSGDPFMISVSPNPLAVLLTSLVSVVYDYLDLAFLLSANGVYFGAEELRSRGAALLRVIAAIGEVDSAISVASVRVSRTDWTRPDFWPAGSRAALTGVRHPLLEDAVPNTIAMDAGRGALVTGSNMSGKTTLLRTVGVTAVLAQTIHTCLATAYEAPVFIVRSCIGRADSLQSGKSYYIAEVEALLELVQAGAGDAPHLFLLDELFRGTNAVERIAAGQAVLHELISGEAGPRPHVVFAATHDGELVDLLAGTFDPYHFGDAVGAEGLVFDHRLRAGSATTRNAIALLRLHGAPETLLRRALACAADLDRQRGVTIEAR